MCSVRNRRYKQRLAWLMSCKNHLKAASQLHAQVGLFEGGAVGHRHGIAPGGLELLLRQLSIQGSVESNQAHDKVLQAEEACCAASDSGFGVCRAPDTHQLSLHSQLPEMFGQKRKI